jgi:hypothetical protein
MLVLLKSGTVRKVLRSRAILRAVQKVVKAMAMVFGGEGVQLIQVTFLGSQTSYYFKAPPRVFEISPTGLFLFLFVAYLRIAYICLAKNKVKAVSKFL